MNPYQSFLGNKDPLEVIAATPGRLRTIVDVLGPSGAEVPFAPGKWNAREILSHLADTEIVFAFRLRQTLAEPHHVIQPYDQDRWAVHYGNYTVQAALAAFTAVREWNVALVRAVPAADYQRPVTHPERGSMTFRVLLETMAGHDLNHLVQLDGIASRAA